MKKIIFSLIILFLASCSKPEDNQVEDNTSSSNIKLLKSVTEDSGNYGQFCSFYYENKVLTKYNYGEKDFYIERNQVIYENKKIKKIAVGGTSNEPTNAEDFTYNYSFTNNPDVETISYTNNSIVYQSRYRDETFNLNNQNQVINILENNSLAEEFTYSGNQILKQKSYLNDKDEYSYTVDDKINPFYELYTNFGLVDNYVCPLVGHAQLYYNLSPNNVTKVYKNGVLLYNFMYQYNSDNYPISAVVFDNSRDETIKYSFAYAN